MTGNEKNTDDITFLSDLNIQMLLFGGKGGVGKTTSATAVSLHLALNNPGASFLLASTDPAHSVFDSLAGFSPPENLEVVEIDSNKCLAEFKAAHTGKLREIASRGTFLDDEDINQFLDLSMPGMDEIMAFLEISGWVEEEKYDLIVVDTAPSGHTLRLLAMPEFIRSWLNALDTLLAKHRYMKKLYSRSYRRDELDKFLLDLSESVTQMNKLLKDPGRCRFVPVMIPEALSISETLTLVNELEKSRIPVKEIIINKLFPDITCPLCSEQRAYQLKGLASLPETLKKYSLWGAHLHPEEVRGPEPLKHFCKNIFKLEDPVSSPIRSIESHTSSSFPIVDNPAAMPAPEMQFLFFAGKGGVGKSTLSSSTAIQLTRQFKGKEILLFSTDPAHSLSACLEMRIGPEPKRVVPGLTALEIDAQAEFETFKEQYETELKTFLGDVLPNFDLTFDREVMEKMMDLSPPGIDELMALTRFIEYLMKGEYDLFILDSAPTGHLLRLLELPEIVDQWLKTFFTLFLKYKRIFRLPGISSRMVKMSKEIKYMRKLLNDGKRSALYAVSIPTEMAYQETLDLVAACTRMGVNVPVIFLNLVSPESGCSLCTSLNRRESRVNEKYRQTFSGRHHSLVYRNLQPRGVKPLGELGNAMYKKP